jgi:3-oxocholest-4-en-26-oyl-CoA dehydrogenase alpha subunit
MQIGYAPHEAALQRELRAYFKALMTETLQEELLRGEGGGPLYHEAMQKMGRDGWLGLGWPKEYGGMGRSAIEQYIFFDEAQYAGFPIPFLTLNTVGPTLMKFGTDEQRAKFLPAILAGRLHFSIGYSEPSAGTDLASLKTRAVRDGDSYVVNGQKVFTSLATHADCIWLAVRTNTEVPKHQGISLIIVDAKLPGVRIDPRPSLGDNGITTTYYENVRVPASCLVGRENEGWRIITTQLNHERVALGAVGPIARFVEEVTAWARQTRLADGRRVIDQTWVQRNLATVYSRLEVLRLMNWRQAANLDKGTLDPSEASAIKVFGSEFYGEASRLLMEVLGPAASIRGGSPEAFLRGRIERYYRAILVLTFGGGTNEVQRDIIATVGLRMPRGQR